MTTQSDQILAISKQLQEIKNLDLAYLAKNSSADVIDRSTLALILTKLGRAIDELNKLSKKV